jgi:hypothetical protein
MSRGPELFVWLVTETAGFEAGWIKFDGLALRVEGRAVGQLPDPYWLPYALETDERAATTGLQVTVVISGRPAVAYRRRWRPGRCARASSTFRVLSRSSGFGLSARTQPHRPKLRRVRVRVIERDAKPLRRRWPRRRAPNPRPGERVG